MKPVVRSLAACLAILALPNAAAVELQAPAWIDAELDDEGLWLTWATVEGATSYNVYLDGALQATLESPGFHDEWSLDAAVYQVTALTPDGESLPATLALADIEDLAGGEGSLAPGTQSSSMSASGQVLTWYIPLTLGGGPPFFSVNWNCVQT